MLCKTISMAGTNKSGKTKGATSFMRVELAELNRCLKPEASVIVNRRYVEALNLEAESFSTNTKNLKQVVTNSVESPIEVEKAQIDISSDGDW